MNKHHLVLEFGYVPTSPYYKRAVDIAENMSGYRYLDKEKVKKHLVPFDENKAEQWLELYDFVSNWKTTKLHYGDRIAPNLKRTTFILACYVRRCEVKNKEEYCEVENWIGCQRVMEGNRLGLYSGEFDGTDIYKPNKNKIKQSVNSHSETLYSICPVFDLDKAISRIDDLPEEIRVFENPNWKPVIHTEKHSGESRLSGISYSKENVIEKGPIINDLDQLDDFEYEDAIQEYRPKTLWEHKVISIDHDLWVSQAEEGEILKINELGKIGWQLVSTVEGNDLVYCIFQRKLIL